MEENHPSFFIANRRYRMLKLKDVEFLDSTPKFDEVFFVRKKQERTMIDNLNIQEKLLIHKGLEPLNSEDLKELNFIQQLDVIGFSEADVREEIINPILKILGYRKGQYFSVDRERHLRFLGKKSKYIDYNMTLWKENFWIIEAKKNL